MRLIGAVDELVDVAPLAPLPESARGPELAVNLHGSGPQSHRLLLDRQPGRLIAFRHPDVPQSSRSPRWREGEHEVERWCRLLSQSGIPADPGRLEIPRPPGEPPAGVEGATVIHPGAASRARRWPPERFAAVARAERAAGRRVVVTGSRAEGALGRTVAAAAGLSSADVLAGRLDLAELAGVVAAAGRVVCGDTGVAHLATALRTPSVVLFGPTPPSAWGPPPGRPWHRVLWAGGCGDPHGDREDPGLLRITPAQVIAALGELPATVQYAGGPR